MSGCGSGKPEKDFILEYAKSGRAKCKKCKSPINKDELRIGKYVQSPHFDGFTPNWFHPECFFTGKAKAVPETSDIQGFMDVSFDDQQKIKQLMASAGGGASKPAKGGSSAGSSSKAAKPPAAAAAAKEADVADESTEGEYFCEIAKSSRGKCRKCEEAIEQGAVKVGPSKRMDRPPFMITGQWHHVECMWKVPEHAHIKSQDIHGFPALVSEDKKEICKQTGEDPKLVATAAGVDAAKPEGKGKKGVKRESDAADDKKPAKKAAKGKKAQVDDIDDDAPLIAVVAPPTLSRDDKAIKLHSEKLQAIRTALKGVYTGTIKIVLEHNGLRSNGGDITLQHRLADVMLHGVPEPCPKCNGVVSYGDGQYACGAAYDAFSKCLYKSMDHKRGGFMMPDGGCGDEYLAGFKFKKVEIPRAMMKENIKAAEAMEKKREKALEIEAKLEARERGEPETPADPATCLKDVVLCIHETKNQKLDKAGIKQKVTKAGGKFVSSCTKDITHVVSTQDAVDNGGPILAAAVKLKLPVVTEEWIDKCIADGRRVTESGCLLRGEARVEPEAGARKRKKHEESKIKLIVKGKGAVDPVSGMNDEAHILEVGPVVYSATLNKTDVSTGANSFYVLQIIESDTKRSTYLFRKWGRIGTSIMNHKLESKGQAEAIKEFERLFLEKSGNHWADRNNFIPVANGMILAELGISSSDDANGEGLTKKIKREDSKLPDAVQRLMSLLFNVDTMKQIMMEMEVDLDKMPLGNLSERQIKKGYEALNDVQSVLENADLDDFERKQRLTAASNKFYTLIPQSFGVRGMTDKWLIDSDEKLKTKIELVQSLLELEIAMSMTKLVGSDTGELSEADLHYAKLKCELKPVEKSSDTFKMVETYLKNTHGKTHSTYTMQLVDLFEVDREGEMKRYEKYRATSNRQLLWHGSRLTNWAGILSQGLRIAPPEAPVTGYMFGKGIYFADSSSKSANYCQTTRANNESLMTLNEVALGDMHELPRAKPSLPAGKPDGKLSVKGIGKSLPDPKGNIVMDDGVVVPCGPVSEVYGIKTELLYNEYIVYDPAQVKTRFLLRVKFEHEAKRGGR